jgi:hypothetical protein
MRYGNQNPDEDEESGAEPAKPINPTGATSTRV